MYKNNTVDDAFKESIRENYFVDVKEIDRQNFNEDESISTTVDVNSNSDDLTHVEDAKRDEKVQEINVVVAPTVSTNDTTNSKDIPDFETLKKTKPAETEDETRLIDDQLDSSKFDEVVEDRQYVEVPVIREEILKQAMADDVAKEDKAKVDPVKETVKAVLKEALKDTTEEAENLEIMKAEARHLGQRQVTCSLTY